MKSWEWRSEWSRWLSDDWSLFPSLSRDNWGKEGEKKSWEEDRIPIHPIIQPVHLRLGDRENIRFRQIRGETPNVYLWLYPFSVRNRTLDPLIFGSDRTSQYIILTLIGGMANLRCREKWNEILLPKELEYPCWGSNRCLQCLEMAPWGLSRLSSGLESVSCNRVRISSLSETFPRKSHCFQAISRVKLFGDSP